MIALTTAAAQRHNLDAALVRAIVEIESGWQIWAWNPEPHYRYLWNVRENAPYRASSRQALEKSPPSDFPTLAGDRDNEWWGQQASWGLMQVMGAVAREYGFREPYLPALCRPADNLDIGCRHLARLQRRFGPSHGVDGVIAAYNAGSPRRVGDGRFENQEYVDKVRSVHGRV